MSPLRSACLLSVVTALLLPGTPVQAQSATIVHVVTAANRPVASVTVLDDPLLNDRPEALPLVSSIFNPDRGPSGVYVNAELTVSYGYVPGRWVISGPPASTLAFGAGFNVWIPRPGAGNGNGLTFVHTATLANSAGNVTQLDHPYLNFNPSAGFTVTKATASNGGLNTHPIGIAYDSGSGRWTIYNEDELPITNGTVLPRYHVGLLFSGLGFPVSSFAAWGEVCSADDVSLNVCYTDLPETNSRLNMLLQRVHFGAYHPKALGLWWAEAYSVWAFYTQDQSAMPEGMTAYLMMTTGLFESGFENGTALGWIVTP